MSENQDRNIVVQRTVDWKSEIGAIAGPYIANDTRESWLSRAARKAKVAHWHAKALFYGTLTDPKFSVACKVLHAAQQARLDEARVDAVRLSEKFKKIAEGLSDADQSVYREDVAALLDADRILRGVDRP